MLGVIVNVITVIVGSCIYPFKHKNRLTFDWKSGGSYFMEWNDYSSFMDIAICSGVMGSSRNHLPVAR